jgi:hypothetical protein
VKWFTNAFPGETQHGNAFLRLALPVVLCFAFLFNAGAEPPLPGTNRFLFIVDTSASAKKAEEPLSEAVFDLVYSGARGAITNGDTFGVWLAGGQNDTSLGVETWKQKFAVETAARLSLRIKEHGFKGSSALDAAIADAKRVAETVQDVTFIISSTGETPLRGTPFDDEINARVQEILPEMRRVKSVFTTVLVARDGKFVAWAVNSPEFLINMPVLPPRAPGKENKEQPIAKAAVAKTNTPAKPKFAANPIIITRETVDREKQAMRAMASTETSATPTAAPAAATNIPAKPATVESNSAVAAKATPVPAASTTSVVSSVAASIASNVLAVAKPDVSISNKSVERAIVETSETEPEFSEKDEATSVSKTNLQPVTSPSSWSQKFIWVLAGCGMMAILFLVCFGVMRRARAYEPSLITQAAALERTRR